jgi:beta-glucosidase
MQNQPATNRLQLRPDSPLRNRGFTFGVATSAFQIEGACATAGRTPSIWDEFCNRPGAIRNGDTGEVACDHYHRWQADVDLIASLNVDAYRFSISWSRVLPGPGRVVNESGLRFYRELVAALRARGIRPIVTLYHWDLPQYLQDAGGWANRATCEEFAHLARIVAGAFGNAVDFFCTINEPWCAAILGHKDGVHAPGCADTAIALAVAHHLLVAHGLATRALREAAPHAQVGIVLNGGPVEAATPDPANVQAASRAEDELIHLFAGPLFAGQYPSAFAALFRPGAGLVLPGDMETIGQPLDFLGWNYYTRTRVVACDGRTDIFRTAPPASDEVTAMGWEVYPDGLARVLRDLVSRYPLPPLYIAENGAAFEDSLEEGAINDPARVDYIGRHLEVVEEMLAEGVDVRGYFYWSLLDNFEWALGYEVRFGLFHVDYRTQKRTPKRSALEFAAMLADRRSGAGCAMGDR